MPSRPAVPAQLVVASLFFVGGVCQCDETCFACDSVDLTDVDHTKVLPDLVYTGPGNSFEIEAIPALANHFPARGQGVPVTWSTHDYFAPGPHGTGRFNIPTGVSHGWISGIEPRVNGQAPRTAGRVKIGRPPGSEAGSVLRLTHELNDPPDAVLLDWDQWLATACGTDTSGVVAMAGEAHLDFALEPGCPSEVAAFSTRKRATLGPAPSAVSELPEVSLTPSATDLTVPRNVLVHMRWDFVNTTEESGDTEVDVAMAMAAASLTAGQIFRTNRTGITFSWVRFPEASGGDFSGEVFPHTCNDITLTESLGVPRTGTALNIVGAEGTFIAGRAAPDGERLPEHEVYVVLVPKISPQMRGYACEENRFRGPVIVLDWSELWPTTLAHELGHIFGMFSEMFDDGHTDASFTRANLMQEAGDMCEGASRLELTVGQAYRMNFARGSWLRLLHDDFDGAPKACDRSDVEGACPDLHADIPGRRR